MSGFTQKLREAIEVLAGFRGPKDRHAVRYGDLKPYLSTIQGATSRLKIMTGDIRDAYGRAEQAWQQHEETLAEADRRLEDVRSNLQSDYDDLKDTSDATQAKVTILEEDLGTTAGTVTDILTLEIDPESVLMGRLTLLEGKAEDAQASADDILSLNVSPGSALLSKFNQLQGEIDANGDDVSDVTGDVQSLYALDLDTSSAFGAWLNEIEVQFGSTEAFTKQAATAYAGIEGLSSTYVIRQRAGAASGYVEAVATDKPNGAPLSTLKWGYDFIDLDGRVSARDLTITEFNGNLIPNGNMRFGDMRAWESADSGWNVFEAKDSGAGQVNGNAPSTYVLSIGSYSVRKEIVLENGIPVTDGDQFSVSFWYYSTGSVDARLVVSWFDRDGNYLSLDVVNGNQSGGSWKKVQNRVTAPSNATRMKITYRREAGGSGYLYTSRMRVIGLDPAETRVTPGSITTPMLDVDAVQARHIDVQRLSAITADLGDIEVDNAHIGRLAVDEINIRDSAVTVVSFDTRADRTLSDDDNWTACAIGTINPKGFPVKGVFHAFITVTNVDDGVEGDITQFRILRSNGAVLASGEVLLKANGQVRFSDSFVDLSPANSATTYSLDIDTKADEISIGRPQLLLEASKK